MNFLKVDIAGHGGLSITESGMKFLRSKESIQFRKSPEKIKAKTTRELKAFAKINLDFENDEEKELYAKLKAKRLEIAGAQKLPPYVIFHDKTLREMIKVKPKNSQDLLKISGVGAAKAERYGQIFLEILLK